MRHVITGLMVLCVFVAMVLLPKIPGPFTPEIP